MAGQALSGYGHPARAVVLDVEAERQRREHRAGQQFEERFLEELRRDLEVRLFLLRFASEKRAGGIWL